MTVRQGHRRAHASTRRSPARVVTEILMMSLIAGIVAGVIWWRLAPEVLVEVRGGQTRLLPLQARLLFGRDAWLAIVSAGAGLLIGTIAIGRNPRSPVTTLLALVGSGLIGSVVAWRVGVILGPPPIEPQVADAAEATLLPLDIDALAVLLVWPLTATILTLMSAVMSRDRSVWELRNKRTRVG